MKVKEFKKINLLAAGLVMLAVLASFYLQSSLIALLALVFYLGLISLLKTRLDESLADERQVVIAEKAAQVAFQILLPMLALASVALMASGNEREFYYLKALGVVLSYVTCAGLVIYLLAYWYFDRQTGGGRD